MFQSQTISKQVTHSRRFAAAVAVAIAVTLPAAAQAGPIEQVKARIDKTYNKVVDTSKRVANMQAQLRQLVSNLHGEGAEQMREAIQSTLQFLQQQQAGYADFVAPDHCGPASDCGAFRAELYDLIQDFAALPSDLPFVEQVPAAAGQLQEVAGLVDFLPPPALYAANQVLGAQIGEIHDMIAMLQDAVVAMPEIPTLAEIVQMNVATAEHYCSTIPGNPHVELVQVILLNQANRLADVADMTQETIDIVAAVGTNLKNPVKFALQLIAFIPKELERQITFQNAAPWSHMKPVPEWPPVPKQANGKINWRRQKSVKRWR